MKNSRFIRLVRSSVFAALTGSLAVFYGCLSSINRYANFDPVSHVEQPPQGQAMPVLMHEWLLLFGEIILSVMGIVGLAYGLAGQSRTARQE